MTQPTMSIITVVFNNRAQIDATVQSVLEQDEAVEYIVVDGGSTDGTREQIQQYSGLRLLSEPDRGMYDALNKGIQLAGGDVVGILHSGDVFSSPGVVSSIAAAFRQYGSDIVFGDSVFVNGRDRVVRRYSGAGFRVSDFSRGMMPPHTAVFVRRRLFLEHGGYDINRRIASDFDLLLRFMLLEKASYTHVPVDVCRMSLGGISTRGIKSTLTINREIRAVCRKHGVATNYFKIYAKYFSKVRQLFPRKHSR